MKLAIETLALLIFLAYIGLGQVARHGFDNSISLVFLGGCLLFTWELWIKPRFNKASSIERQAAAKSQPDAKDDN